MSENLLLFNGFLSHDSRTAKPSSKQRGAALLMMIYLILHDARSGHFFQGVPDVEEAAVPAKGPCRLVRCHRLPQG
jgi:hypothetical protein